MRDGSRVNGMKSSFISSWFGVHWATSQILWWHQCPSRLVIVFLVSLWSPLSISSHLTCLIRNMEWLSKQWRAIVPHLAEWVNSHVFWGVWREPGLHSRVTSGKILQSSCLLSELSTPVRLGEKTQESPRGLAGQYGQFSRWGGRSSVPFELLTWYWDSYQLSKRVRHCHLLKHWTPCASKGVNGFEAQCPNESGTYDVL